MGLFHCMRAQDDDEENSRQIDREIKQWIRTYNDAIKLLLLGTGESGKTTIIKQMKILHIQGFSNSDRLEKFKHIRHNIHESIYDIVRHMSILSIGLQNLKNVEALHYILRCGPDGPADYNEEYFDYVHSLWRDGGVRECFRRSNEYQLIDSAEYFIESLRGGMEYRKTNYTEILGDTHDDTLVIPSEQGTIYGSIRLYDRSDEHVMYKVDVFQFFQYVPFFLDRVDLIAKPDYLPSDADILRCRQKTTGIQKIEFQVKVPKSMHGGVQDFWMFDVGGQRGERKKWIQVFEGINAIWFIVACSDFDQRLREDGSQNRLREAVALFEDVWQSRFLLEAGLIVFLNKQDLLEQKIAQGRSISPYFPEFQEYQAAGDEYTRTKTFIRSMFVDITTQKRDRRKYTQSPEKFVITEATRPRECYFHYTTATDTDNVRTVFRDVHQIILTHILNTIGVY